MNVRRLAAIDMWGTKGTLRRRRIILVEFLLGAVLVPGLGTGTLFWTGDLGGRVLGWWLLGMGLNYVPLAVHAILLSPSGALERELTGVDTYPELKRYAVLQLWILVPLSLVVFQARQSLTRSAR